MNQTFRRITSGFAQSGSTILVGSTTSGFVFAIDIDTGDEVWATQASDQIAGVKGVTAGYDGLVFVATNRCVDRYCYRYRSVTNPLTPGNSYVRALRATDGAFIWGFRPNSPLWNFVPQFSQSGNTVMFNDYEGAVYSLDIESGTLQWRAEGAMGTHTQASCVYNGETNQVFALGVAHYDGDFCNPYVPKGIQPPCGTGNDWPGWVRALNASSGRVEWETPLPQPPAGAAVGYLNTPRFHTRLVVTMGFNCHYGAKSELWTISPESGHPRVKVEGPTLWTARCAGDQEGGDVRRAQTGRAYCEPGSWSTPVIDGNGDIFVGSQVGELQRLGADSAAATGSKDFRLLSTLTTDVAFQDGRTREPSRWHRTSWPCRRAPLSSSSTRTSTMSRSGSTGRGSSCLGARTTRPGRSKREWLAEVRHCTWRDQGAPLDPRACSQTPDDSERSDPYELLLFLFASWARAQRETPLLALRLQL
ncbi:unnamed protein product [Prorocentrum cordatum]|uniref:Pyrrolo-quinoline quinone repeat domain-containing protein n=1 Tax=Prorocentrum cordatum TaxID=2364126 RepID=A0ABN9R0Q7_9DINO|nr:unnamed protein product [Polarella glacialis]